MRNKANRVARAAQQGFTLIEMVVVVAVIGVLIALIAPTLSGSRDGATAKLMASTAQQAASSLGLLTTTAGIDPNASLSSTATSATLGTILFGGKAGLNSTYHPAWDQAGLLPITAASPDTTNCSTTGSYKVGPSCVAVSANATQAIITYSNVPTNIIKRLYQQIDPISTLTTGTLGELTVSGTTATYTKTIR